MSKCRENASMAFQRFSRGQTRQFQTGGPRKFYKANYNPALAAGKNDYELHETEEMHRRLNDRNSNAIFQEEDLCFCSPEEHDELQRGHVAHARDEGVRVAQLRSTVQNCVLDLV
jgi:hypothetical protein